MILHHFLLGVLRELDAPGHFEQQLYFYGVGGPIVDYNVIYIDDEVAVEYDCSDHGSILGSDGYKLFQKVPSVS